MHRVRYDTVLVFGDVAIDIKCDIVEDDSASHLHTLYHRRHTMNILEKGGAQDAEEEGTQGKEEETTKDD